MKVIKSYNVEGSIAETVREYSWALQKSESQFCEDALRYYIEHGMDKDTKDEFQKRREVLDSIKASRNRALKECGG